MSCSPVLPFRSLELSQSTPLTPPPVSFPEELHKEANIIEEAIAASLHKNPLEVFEIAREWNEKRKIVEAHCPPAKQHLIDEASLHFFLLLCRYQRPAKWEDGFLNLFPFVPEQQTLIAERLIRKAPEALRANFSTLVVDEDAKETLAHALIEKGLSLADCINSFQIQNEGSRLRLALHELKQFSSLDDIAFYMVDYNLQAQESREALAKSAAQITPQALAKYLDILDIADEGLRFELLKEAAKKAYNCDDFYSTKALSSLSPTHRLELAQFIGAHTPSTSLLSSLDKFDLDPIAVKQLMTHIEEKNPALLPTCTLFTEVQAKLETLHQTKTWQETKQVLDELLSTLHTLNTQIAIPTLFYSSRSQGSLGTYLTQRASHLSPQEIVELVHLINTHFFCASPILLHAVLESVQKDYPDLNRLLSIKKTPIPELTPHGITTLLQMKESVYPIIPCFLGNAHTLLNNFYEVGYSRGILLVNILTKRGSHTTPLILERQQDTLRILVTDSTFDSKKEHLDALFSNIRASSIKKEIYCIPFGRQNDSSTSPVFSLMDSFSVRKAWKENPTASFIELVRQQGSLNALNWKGVSYQAISQYPTHMLRATQSLAKIASRAKETFRHQQKETSLEEYVQRHTYVFADYTRGASFFQPTNLASFQKLGKYVEKIVTLFFSPIVRTV